MVYLQTGHMVKPLLGGTVYVTFPSILAYLRPWPGYILYPEKLHNSTLKTKNIINN